MILPDTGRGTIRRRANGGGGAALRKPGVYVARQLRRTMSLPEAVLWQRLRRQQLGFKVRRQHPIGPYVVDFFAPQRSLVIEIDGEAHNRADRPLRDRRKDAFLKLNGYSVLRVAAVDVLGKIEGVVAAISERMTSPLHRPLDGPPPQIGEDL